MAWYSGIFSCGCEGRINVIGKEKDRAWKIERSFSGVCPDCYSKMLEKQRQEENAKALAASQEMELPELKGSEKQIAWANTLRVQMLEQVDSYYEELSTNTRAIVQFAKAFGLTKEEFDSIKDEDMKDYLSSYARNVVEIAKDILASNTSAKFFIDNRSLRISSIIDDLKEEILKSTSDTEALEEKIKQDIIDETTVEPSNVTEPGVVIISFDEKGVDVKYEKNETLRILVKEAGYEWSGSSWHLAFKERLLSTAERAAEIGNKLLNKGFRISIQDIEVLSMAVHGTYKNGYTRWITTKNNKLALFWAEKNDKLYKQSRQISTSQWESPYVTINVSHFDEVLDFAHIHDFGISDTAFKLIEDYKEQIERARKVIPVEILETEKEDKLGNILNSSTDVLDDLRDQEE